MPWYAYVAVAVLLIDVVLTVSHVGRAEILTGERAAGAVLIKLGLILVVVGLGGQA